MPLLGTRGAASSGGFGQFLRSSGGSSNSRAYITFTNDSSSYRTDSSVGTVSGSSISLTSLGQLLSSQAPQTLGLSVCYDPSNLVFVYVYRDNTDAEKGKAVVVTPNGSFTSVSVGTPVTFDSSVISYPMVTYIGSGKVCIIYQDEGNNDYATSIIGTVSGTSISFGSPVVIHTSPAGIRNDCFGIASDGAGGVVYPYMDGSTGYGYIKAATVSGTTPTWGSAVAFESSATARWSAVAYSTSAAKYALVYQTSTSADGFGRVVTVTGTSVSLSSATTYETGSVVCNAIAYDPTNNAFAILYNEVATIGGSRVIKATMGSTLSYSSQTLFRSASNNLQTAGANGVVSSSGLGKVVGINWNGASTNSIVSAVIDLSGASPTVGSSQTVVNSSQFYGPSIACT